MATLKSNRINDMSPGSTIDDAFRDLEASLSEIMGVSLDVEYNSAQVAPISMGVTGGNQHSHDGVDTPKLVHGTTSNPGALIDVGQYSHEQIDAHINGTGYHHTGYELVSNKGQPGGYCPLDSSGKVPSQHLPQLSYFRDCMYTYVQGFSIPPSSSILVPFSVVYAGTGYTISNNEIVCQTGIHAYFVNIKANASGAFAISVDGHLGGMTWGQVVDSIPVGTGYSLSSGVCSFFQKQGSNNNNLQIVLTNLSTSTVNVDKVDFTIFRISGVTI